MSAVNLNNVKSCFFGTTSTFAERSNHVVYIFLSRFNWHFHFRKRNSRWGERWLIQSCFTSCMTELDSGFGVISMDLANELT
ncbi:hypothetical protein D3C76_1642530 [compost metagenome]